MMTTTRIEADVGDGNRDREAADSDDDVVTVDATAKTDGEAGEGTADTTSAPSKGRRPR